MGEVNILEDDGSGPACYWVRHAWNENVYMEAWQGLAELLGRPWWSRCWVLQEAVLSSQLVVCCGFHPVPWDGIGLVLHAVKHCKMAFSPDSFPNSHSPSLDDWTPMDRIASARRSWKPNFVTFNLVSTRQCRASDPRDHV